MKSDLIKDLISTVVTEEEKERKEKKKHLCVFSVYLERDNQRQNNTNDNK